MSIPSRIFHYIYSINDPISSILLINVTIIFSLLTSSVWSADLIKAQWLCSTSHNITCDQIWSSNAYQFHQIFGYCGCTPDCGLYEKFENPFCRESISPERKCEYSKECEMDDKTKSVDSLSYCESPRFRECSCIFNHHIKERDQNKCLYCYHCPTDEPSRPVQVMDSNATLRFEVTGTIIMIAGIFMTILIINVHNKTSQQPSHLNQPGNSSSNTILPPPPSPSPPMIMRTERSTLEDKPPSYEEAVRGSFENKAIKLSQLCD